MSSKKVLLYNWVQFDDSNLRGGGVSVYLKNIIPEYLDRNYHVTFLSSGDQYSLFTKRIFYEKTNNIYRDRGVRSFRIVNSPVLAPSYHSFNNIQECRENLPIAQTCIKFFEEQGGFDEIHLHSIEGISTKVIELSKQHFPETKIAIWIHNYHWVCPQIELFKDNSKICNDYNNGIDCIGCLPTISDSRYIKRAQKVKRLANYFKLTNTRFEELFYSIFRAGSQLFESTNQLFTFKPKFYHLSCKDNIYEQSINLETSNYKAGHYQDWRQINISRINRHVDFIFTVSDQIKDVINRFGIDSKNVFVVPLGMDVFKPKSEVLKLAKSNWKGKLKIGFFGNANQSKGINFLIETLSDLPEDHLNKLKVRIFSRTGDWTKRKIVRLSNQVELELDDGYRRENMSELVKQIDIAIVPSLWLETFNQVSYELLMLGVPILMSDSVGFKMFVNNNDFIFKSGDKSSLQSKLGAIINGEVALCDYWVEGDYPLSISEHFDLVDTCCT